ncbi:MAG: hypothetical protein GY832_36250 [Chloroflexi bacterium]|nr:hypothetical protein [Chloroflexota bacterium]
MDRDLWFMLVGAGIGLGSAIIGAFVQFGLSLWKDRITKALAKKEEGQEEMERIRKLLMSKELEEGNFMASSGAHFALKRMIDEQEEEPEEPDVQEPGSVCP